MKTSDGPSTAQVANLEPSKVIGGKNTLISLIRPEVIQMVRMIRRFILILYNTDIFIAPVSRCQASHQHWPLTRKQFAPPSNNVGLNCSASESGEPY